MLIRIIKYIPVLNMQNLFLSWNIWLLYSIFKQY